MVPFCEPWSLTREGVTVLVEISGSTVNRSCPDLTPFYSPWLVHGRITHAYWPRIRGPVMRSAPPWPRIHGAWTGRCQQLPEGGGVFWKLVGVCLPSQKLGPVRIPKLWRKRVHWDAITLKTCSHEAHKVKLITHHKLTYLIWTNGDPDYWRIYVALSLNKLIYHLNQGWPHRRKTNFKASLFGHRRSRFAFVDQSA